MKKNWKFWTTLGVVIVFIVTCLFLPDDVLLASLIGSLAIPVAAFSAIWLFHKEIRERISKVKKAKVTGVGEVEFAELAKEYQKQSDSVAESTTIDSGVMISEDELIFLLSKLCMGSLIIASYHALENKKKDDPFLLSTFKSRYDDLVLHHDSQEESKKIRRFYSNFQRMHAWPDIDKISFPPK